MVNPYAPATLLQLAHDETDGSGQAMLTWLAERAATAAEDADRRSCQGGWRLAQERAVRVIYLEAALRPLIERMAKRRGVLASADPDIARAQAALNGERHAPH